MNTFLLTAALFVLLTVAVGLVSILLGPTRADRLMAVQLLGTGSIAALLLASGAGLSAAADAALTLAILAAFLAVAFVKYSSNSSNEKR